MASDISVWILWDFPLKLTKLQRNIWWNSYRKNLSCRHLSKDSFRKPYTKFLSNSFTNSFQISLGIPSENPLEIPSAILPRTMTISPWISTETTPWMLRKFYRDSFLEIFHGLLKKFFHEFLKKLLQNFIQIFFERFLQTLLQGSPWKTLLGFSHTFLKLFRGFVFRKIFNEFLSKILPAFFF